MKLQVGSLDLDAILKLLAKLKGDGDMGKPYPEIPSLKAVFKIALRAVSFWKASHRLEPVGLCYKYCLILNCLSQ